MKKLAILALPLLLAACGGSTPLGLGSGKINIGVSTSDGGSGAIVTKTITRQVVNDKGEVTTPYQETYSTTDVGSAEFVFAARPGSDAAYITGYRITRFLINGEDILGGSTPESNKMNMYVGSGYNCTERTAVYSCPSNGTNLVLANGISSATQSINFTGPVVSEAIATDAPASAVVDLEFVGKSSSNQDVVIPVKGIVTYVAYKVVYN